MKKEKGFKLKNYCSKIKNNEKQKLKLIKTKNENEDKNRNENGKGNDFNFQNLSRFDFINLEKTGSYKRRISLKEAGITLIALVITIIVLLILAGVSISAAINGNGLFARARKTGNVWQSATENEQKALDEMSDTYDDLAYEYAGIEKPPKPLLDKDGKEYKQNDVVATTEDGVTLNWKLFYDDNGTKYLKADPVYWEPDEAKLDNGARKPKLLTDWDPTSVAIRQAIQADTPMTDADSSRYVSSKVTYTPSDASYNFFKSQNPVWNEKRGNTNFSDLDENEKCSVYLSDPEVWSAYKDKLETALGRKVKYVYGSPSADLYCKAYNAQDGIKDEEKITLQYVTEEFPGHEKSGGYKYTQNSKTGYSTDSNSLKVNGKAASEIFIGDKWWYLSSPSAFYNLLCYVDRDNAYLNHCFSGDGYYAVSLVAVVE